MSVLVVLLKNLFCGFRYEHAHSQSALEYDGRELFGQIGMLSIGVVRNDVA